jgi:PAS domain S-box-containing protein
MLDLVRLLTFPHDDVAFAAHIEAARVRLGRWDPPFLEAEVRKAYPNATFRKAAKLAQFYEDAETWYAFRDGKLGDQHDERWWDASGIALTVMDSSGNYLDCNDEAADLFGVTRDTVLAGRAGDFTKHEGTDEVRRALFSELARRGELHSTAVVARPDGEEWPIEYRTWRVARSDDYMTAMRRVRPDR